MNSQSNQPNPHNHRRRRFAVRKPLALASAALFAASIFCSAPAFAVNKDMVQLQTQIQQLQDSVARLQQSNDERMGVMKDLVQQSADSINKMSSTVEALQKQMQAQQEAQNGKLDQVSGQIQSLNDSLDEVKARIASLEKLMQSVQSQQQSISAGMQGQPNGGGASAPSGGAPPQAAPQDVPQTQPAPIERRGKPQAGTPMTEAVPPPSPTAGAQGGSAAPPADELYKTALGDYMSAKYALSSSEFADVVKFYPDNPLSGNSLYYMAEIEYRGGHYADAIKNYDGVMQQYPDSNKVPVSHLHKGMALIALKQNDAGVRELRSLIQRFPNSPEAMQARSKLSGMGVLVTPKH
jgi:TolA-binding protein